MKRWRISSIPTEYVLPALALLAALSALLSLCLGAVSVAPGEVLPALFGRGGGAAVQIVRYVRLPRTCGCLLAGEAVSFAGLLGFVGLIAPHIMRRLAGEDSSARQLCASALGGASLLTLCDVLDRTLFAPYELPVGVVLSLLGGPFFISLLLRQRRGGTGHG